MIEVKVYIKKSVIYNEVAKITSYIGAKRIDADQNVYERVFSTEDDRELLERYWREAKSDLTDIVSRWLVGSSKVDNSQVVDDAEVWEITLNMPHTFHLQMVDALDEDIHSFMIHSIIFKWLSVSEPKEAEYYHVQMMSKKESITKKLMYRIKPLSVRMSGF